MQQQLSSLPSAVAYNYQTLGSKLPSTVYMPKLCKSEVCYMISD